MDCDHKETRSGENSLTKIIILLFSEPLALSTVADKFEAHFLAGRAVGLVAEVSTPPLPTKLKMVYHVGVNS